MNWEEFKEYINCRGFTIERYARYLGVSVVSILKAQNNPHKLHQYAERITGKGVEISSELIEWLKPHAENRKKEEIRKTRSYASARMCTIVDLGWIVRPEGKWFHHPDYHRPFYGCWVTPKEHGAIHSKNPPTIDLEMIDYWPEIRERYKAFRKEKRESKQRIWEIFAMMKNLGRRKVQNCA